MKKTIITTNNRSIEPGSESKRVFVPLYFGGEKGRTIDYGIMCMRDSLVRKDESPLMPDLAYIQCINESDNAEMSRAGSASNEWLRQSDKVAIYIDRGVSMAMSNTFMVCTKMRKGIEFRTLSKNEDMLNTTNMLNENILNIGVIVDIFEKINKQKKTNLIQSREYGDYCGEWSEDCDKKLSAENNQSMIEKIATREAILKMNEAPIPIGLMMIGNQYAAAEMGIRLVNAWGSGETELITLTTGVPNNIHQRVVSVNEFGYDASLLREINKECYGTSALGM